MTIIEPRARRPSRTPTSIVGDGSEPHVLAAGRPGRAVGFVAGTDNDTTNLSLVAAARRVNPDLFVAARQNQPASAPLFAADASSTRCWCPPRWSRTRCTRS